MDLWASFSSEIPTYTRWSAGARTSMAMFIPKWVLGPYPKDQRSHSSFRVAVYSDWDKRKFARKRTWAFLFSSRNLALHVMAAAVVACPAIIKNAPFFVAKLVIKTMPCVVLFRKGIAEDRLVGFQDLRGKDDFTTRMLEAFLVKKAIISEKNDNEDDEAGDYPESRHQTVRSSADAGSDSD